MGQISRGGVTFVLLSFEGPDRASGRLLRRLAVAARDRGLRLLTASEAVEVHGLRSHALPRPVFPTTQSDNLHLIQWFGRSGAEAEVSAYFTPGEWWSLGPEQIVREMQAVYENFIRALGRAPARRRRRATALAPLEPEVAALTRPVAGLA